MLVSNGIVDSLISLIDGVNRIGSRDQSAKHGQTEQYADQHEGGINRHKQRVNESHSSCRIACRGQQCQIYRAGNQNEEESDQIENQYHSLRIFESIAIITIILHSFQHHIESK